MCTTAPTGRASGDAGGPAPVGGERADPGFGARFAEAYRGRHDPADALWWADHPGADGPSGAPSPTAPLAALRRAVYSGRGTPADAVALGTLLEDIERDGAAVEAALTAATARARLGSAAPSAAGSATGSLAGSAAGPGATSADDPGAARAPRIRRPARLLLLAAGIVGVAVGAAVASGRTTGPTDTPTTTSAATIGTVIATVRAPLSELQRPGTAADRTTALLGPDLIAGSLRRVASTEDPAAVFYLGRDRAGEVCLIAATVYYSASCAPDSIAGTRGLALAWSGPERLSGSGTVVAVLDPDGRLRIGRPS